jgi:hypothetical protein
MKTVLVGARKEVADLLAGSRWDEVGGQGRGVTWVDTKQTTLWYANLHEKYLCDVFSFLGLGGFATICLFRHEWLTYLGNCGPMSIPSSLSWWPLTKITIDSTLSLSFNLLSQGVCHLCWYLVFSNTSIILLILVTQSLCPPCLQYKEKSYIKFKCFFSPYTLVPFLSLI